MLALVKEKPNNEIWEHYNSLNLHFEDLNYQKRIINLANAIDLLGDYYPGKENLGNIVTKYLKMMADLKLEYDTNNRYTKKFREIAQSISVKSQDISRIEVIVDEMAQNQVKK